MNTTSIASVLSTPNVLAGIVVPGMTLGFLASMPKHVLAKLDICVLPARSPGEPRGLPLQKFHISFCYVELI